MNRRQAAQMVAVVMGVLIAPQASADCVMWDLNGHWEFWQSNKAKATFDLQQDPSGKITGNAYFEMEGPDSIFTSFGIAGSGPVSGEMAGSRFNFVVRWDGGPGEYRGDVGPGGQLSGSTWDVNQPEATASWHEWAGRRAQCMTAQTPPSSKNDAVGIEAAPRAGTEFTPTLPFKPPPRAGADFGGDPAGTPAQKTATAIDDVDIWDGAGPPGRPYRCGNINCFLSPGDGPQPVLEHHADGWYRLQTGKVPPGSGWVAEDHLTVQ